MNGPEVRGLSAVRLGASALSVVRVPPPGSDSQRGRPLDARALLCSRHTPNLRRGCAMGVVLGFLGTLFVFFILFMLFVILPCVKFI